MGSLAMNERMVAAFCEMGWKVEHRPVAAATRVYRRQISARLKCNPMQRMSGRVSSRARRAVIIACDR